jgi:hypothetical protein
MTMFGTSWGLSLDRVTPVAKLVAIRLGDACDQDAQGATSLAALAAWCGASKSNTLAALAQLQRRHDVIWRLDGDRVEYQLPSGALPERLSRNPLRHEGKLTIYVMSGRHGVKVGITSKLVERVYSLRNAMLDDTIRSEWSRSAPTSVIRRAERRAHASLAAKLVRNEWFSATVAEAIRAAEDALDEMLAERG